LKIQAPVLEDYLVAASGERLKIIGNVDISLQVRGLAIPHIFTLIEGLYPNLLVGTDFLTANQAAINCRNHTVSFYDGLIVLPLQNFQSSYNCATLKTTVCIPAYSEAIIPVSLPRGFSGDEVILEPLRTVSYPVLLGGSLSSALKGIAYMKALNCHPHSVILKRRTKMASVLFPNNISAIQELREQTNKPNFVPQNPPDAKTLENFVKEYKITINPNLTSPQRLEFGIYIHGYLCQRFLRHKNLPEL